MKSDAKDTTDRLCLFSKDDRGRAAEYLDKALHSFIVDPPDTDFQRGYQEALRETYRVLLGRFP
jgi:hypothetical protein